MLAPELIFKLADVGVIADHRGWTVTLRGLDLVTFHRDRAAALRFALDLAHPADVVDLRDRGGAVLFERAGPSEVGA